MPISSIRVSYEPPSHGWLSLTVLIDEQAIQIDASDVPNNPVEDLLSALELAANGVSSSVWWNLEPDAYFMYFTPLGGSVHFKIVYAANSKPAQGQHIVEFSGTTTEVLLPFWRFVREFQTHKFEEPDWRETDLSRINAVRDRIRLSGA